MKKLLENSYYSYIAIIFAGIIAAAISLCASLGQPVWFDEGYSILLAQQSFSDLFSLTAVDAHPPFYYALLKIWMMIFGDSELVIRSLSAILFGGAVGVLLLTIKRIFGVRVLYLSIPILLLAPFALRYGYEIRMYALAMFIGITATYVLVRAIQSKNRVWWGVYAVLVALGMYTLYMMVAVWLAHAVWLAATSIKKGGIKNILSWPWVYAFFGSIILFTPYIPTFFDQMRNSALPGVGSEISLTKLVDMLTMLFLFKPEWAIGGWWSLALLAVIMVFAYLTYKVISRANHERRYWIGLLASLSIVPVLFFALISLPPREPVYIVRYIAHIAPYMYAFIAIIIAIYVPESRIARLRKVGIYVSVCAVLLVGVFNLFATGNFNFERMQDPRTAELRKNVNCENTIVVADDPYTYIDSNYYYQDCAMYFYSRDDIAYRGGYAPLSDSTAQIRSSDDISDKRIIHLHWVTDGSAAFVPSNEYKKVNEITLDKQRITVYER